MTLKTELDLGIRAAERERYIISALNLYTEKTGYAYFHAHVPEAIASGKSAWGHLKYPQNKEKYDCHLNKSFGDLNHYGLFDIDPQYFYRNYSELFKIRDIDIDAIPFGLLASKRTYRVLTEISKVKIIKDYKLFGRVMTGKKVNYLNDFQPRYWKCKIRGYYFMEIDDLIQYGLITATDGSAGYRKYDITEYGRDFMRDNQQYLSDKYRI